jgi:hypothetical protein
MQVRMIRRSWSILIVAALLGLLALATISMARADSHVIPDGDVAGLIAAIDAANASGQPTTIVLAENGEYVLTTENNPDNGLPVIVGSVTIEGHGATVRRSDAANTPAFRIFQVDSGGHLTLQHLTVSNGRVDGSSPTSNGGGIYTSGTLELTDSTVSGNSAERYEDDFHNGNGGGIYNREDGALTLTNSTVSGNTALLLGGGIYNEDGDLTLTSSTVSGNSANLHGGGIYNRDGTVTVTGSTVSGNRAWDGGGIYNWQSTVTVTNSTVSGNTSSGGGGGIYIDDGDLTLTSSTVSGNSASGNGGGIFNWDGDLTLTSSTVSGNSVLSGLGFGGGGIYNHAGSVTLTGSLVAENTAQTQGNDFHGAVTNTSTHNLIGDGDGMTGLTDTSNQAGTNAEPIDPRLGPLQNNGGPTETMALLDGSPALNVIPGTACSVTSDQRGIDRPQGDKCDIGAFELEVDNDPKQPVYDCVDGFGNQFFEGTWARTDLPVKDHGLSRTWMWGPCAFTDVLSEPYAESPDGDREIVYFDKARMEINLTGEPEDSLWYVTNGLLVNEMISGMRQFGDNTFVDYGSAEVNVAGDADDVDGPTYASFAGLLNEPAQPVGTLLNQQVDRVGVTSENAGFDAHGVTVGHVDQVTSHGIAGPFWEFMNSQGQVYENGELHTQALFENPFYATGRPVTEAYWATVQVANQPRDVLMQCFERRCLTYTPGNPEGFVVEAGNVGQHYYAWRYVHAPDGP